MGRPELCIYVPPTSTRLKLFRNITLHALCRYALSLVYILYEKAWTHDMITIQLSPELGSYQGQRWPGTA